MSLTGKFILAALAAVLLILFIPPLLATIVLVGFLVGLFGAAVVLWACVLLGERWVDEGLGDYNYLDALDDALNDIFQGLRGLFAPRVRKSLKERLVAAWPLIKARAGVSAFWALSPLVFVVAVLRDGYRKTLIGFRFAADDTARAWRRPAA